MGWTSLGIKSCDIVDCGDGLVGGIPCCASVNLNSNLQNPHQKPNMGYLHACKSMLGVGMEGCGQEDCSSRVNREMLSQRNKMGSDTLISSFGHIQLDIMLS